MSSLWARITGDHDLEFMGEIVARVEEIRQVAEADRLPWLAGQLDEIHVELTDRMDTLSDQINDMKRLLLGGLIGILTAAITIPIAILWGAAIASGGS